MSNRGIWYRKGSRPLSAVLSPKASLEGVLYELAENPHSPSLHHDRMFCAIIQAAYEDIQPPAQVRERSSAGVRSQTTREQRDMVPVKVPAFVSSREEGQ